MKGDDEQVIANPVINAVVKIRPNLSIFWGAELYSDTILNDF